ncbi:MAG: ABC transporter permease [Clostridiales bacterium]|nr:ABC transporter permease [Clostridiales bacterium]
MRKNHVLHVIKSEWKKTRKTPVQLVTMLLVPLLSVLFLSWCLSYVNVLVNRYKGTVYFPEEISAEEMEETLSEFYPDFSFRSGTMDDAKTRVGNGRTDCAVVVEEKTIRILYDSSILTSSAALKDAKDLGLDISYLLSGKEFYDEVYEIYPETETLDLSTSADRLDSYLDRVGGVVGMIIFLMMSSNAMAISARSITGEKERQTFDTLVLSPAKLSKILTGKVLVMMAEIFLSGFVGFAAGIAGMAVWSPKEFAAITDNRGNVFVWLLVVLAILFAATLVITAVFSVIGSAFAQTKKASLFSSAGMVIVSVTAMLPSFIDAEVIRMFPLSNWTPLLKDLCEDDFTFNPIFTALAIGLLLFGLSMILSSALWERRSE